MYCICILHDSMYRMQCVWKCSSSIVNTCVESRNLFSVWNLFISIHRHLQRRTCYLFYFFFINISSVFPHIKYSNNIQTIYKVVLKHIFWDLHIRKTHRNVSTRSTYIYMCFAHESSFQVLLYPEVHVIWPKSEFSNSTITMRNIR